MIALAKLNPRITILPYTSIETIDCTSECFSCRGDRALYVSKLMETGGGWEWVGKDYSSGPSNLC